MEVGSETQCRSQPCAMHAPRNGDQGGWGRVAVYSLAREYITTMKSGERKSRGPRAGQREVVASASHVNL